MLKPFYATLDYQSVEQFLWQVGGFISVIILNRLQRALMALMGIIYPMGVKKSRLLIILRTGRQELS